MTLNEPFFVAVNKGSHEVAQSPEGFCMSDTVEGVFTELDMWFMPRNHYDIVKVVLTKEQHHGS